MDIRSITKRARDLSREAFAAQLRCLLLVVPKTEAGDGIVLQTESNVLGSETGSRLEAELGEVVAIAKSDRNPFNSRIAVGRARNCDIVLRHRSVSKLHAEFRHLSAGRLEIVDLGSRNHTRLNGQKLDPKAPAPLRPADVIQFGDVVTQLVDAGTLYDLLVQIGG